MNYDTRNDYFEMNFEILINLWENPDGEDL